MDEKSEKKIEGFLDSRLGWNRIFQHPIPVHANNITYTLGGMLLVLGIVQGITGVMLQQFYHPQPVEHGAYDSLLEIVSRADLVFVRNLHYWGAQLMVMIVLLHMVRVFISGSYKKPREIQWLAGIGLLVLLFGFTFSGTVLKWDQEAIEALGHQVEVAETIGAFGNLFTSQFAPNVPLLVRFYAAHVTVIPILALPVLALHLVLIRLLGMSSPMIRKGQQLVLGIEQKIPFSTHVKRMLSYGVGVTVIAIILSLLLPAPLTMRGVEGIEITKPPWYLLWIFPLEDIFGLGVIPYVSGMIVIILAAVPLVDRKGDTDPRRRKIMIAGMFVLVAIFVGLMIAGAITPIAEHL